MFDEQDRQYFARRAKVSRGNAEAATDLAVRRIHLDLAEEYERRAEGRGPRSVLHLPR